MSERSAEDRRAAPVRGTDRPGTAGRLVSALRAGLYRPLAEDDDRAAYWVRHVRNGVLLTPEAIRSTAYAPTPAKGPLPAVNSRVLM